MYYRSLCLALFIFTLPFTGIALDSVGYNRINISIASQMIWNKVDIHNDYIGQNTVSAKNTLSYYAGIEFQRFTRSGLFFSAGLHIGTRKYNVSITHNASEFDPEAKNNLKGQVFNYQVSPLLYYTDPGIYIGYKRNFAKNWSYMIKIGTSFRLNLNGYKEVTGIGMGYYTDDSSAFKVEKVATYQILLGETLNRKIYSNNHTSSKLSFHNFQHMFGFYAGVERQLSTRIIKTIAINVEASWNSLSKFQFSYPVEVISRVSTQDNTLSYDRLADRNIAFGISLSVGLWK
jgi:hypothetical protein